MNQQAFIQQSMQLDEANKTRGQDGPYVGWEQKQLLELEKQ